MSARTPISLRPDRAAYAREQRRALVQTCVAIGLGARQGIPPARILKGFDNPRADLILKAVSDPAATTSASTAALQLTTTRVLPMLAPASASARLLALATTLDLSGLQAIKLPLIGQSGRPPVAFTLEGDPMQVVDLTVGAVTLGPARSLRIAPRSRGKWRALPPAMPRPLSAMRWR